MKITKTLFLCLLCILSMNAQTDCKAYVPTKEGTKWELTNYTAKGKITGKIQYELTQKTVSGNTVTFKITTRTFDKKDKEIFTSSYEAKCIDGVFDLNMAVKMDGNQLKAYNNVDVEVDASKYEIPDLDAPAGTTLADGSLKVGIGTGGINMNMTILITDRKVDAREHITTPAGDFDCIVLSQNVSTKMLLRAKAKSKEWYAENVGLIRSESYNKKGKLMGYSELTKLEL